MSQFQAISLATLITKNSLPEGLCVGLKIVIFFFGSMNKKEINLRHLLTQGVIV